MTLLDQASRSNMRLVLPFLQLFSDQAGDIRYTERGAAPFLAQLVHKLKNCCTFCYTNRYSMGELYRIKTMHYMGRPLAEKLFLSATFLGKYFKGSHISSVPRVALP
ncbi:hypothetical protein BBF93_10720 [Hyphomonas sp. CACIAM 19H1]|nr:hypothetical protein BBF93_10720 [Hyphomonas sp. CACIAM 19H1]